MQQTIGLKRFVVAHVGATALALAVLVSSGLAIAGLAATGNAPWMSGSASQDGAQQSAVQSMHTAQEVRFFEAKLARQDALELQASVLVAKAAAHQKLLRFYAHKEEQLLALSAPSPTSSTPGELTPAQPLAKYRQYNPTVDGPGSSAMGRLLRDYARYNPTMDAVPAPTASATTRQWCASPRHIGFMGLRFVSCASTMGHGNEGADK